MIRGFGVDCRMSFGGTINDNIELLVIASDTIDSLMERATRLYLQRNFPPSWIEIVMQLMV